MSTLPFSVLLPVYAGDSPSFVRRAYASVTVDQSLPPDEVVLVQDGPVGAELAEVIAHLHDSSTVDVRILVLEENVGLARALDAGLAACSHDVVARMDADDIARPDRFAEQLALIAGGYDIVGSAIQEFADERSPGAVRIAPGSSQEIEQSARFRSPFNHPTVVFRRAAVRAAGGYEDLPLMEDYWLWARMIAQGARGRNLPEPLVMYRVGAGAYARRGGRNLLRSEVELQRRMRRIGFTTRTQFARNLLVRGTYRLVPEQLRRRAYRSLFAEDRPG